MVFFFTSTSVDPPAFLYMGKDKFENEDLIAYGYPEDIWFHVDKLSSAHVYIRLPEGQTIEDIAEALLEDCAQLVKQNSIEGCKHAVSVVYTPWSNLKKTSDMAPGQVSFHDRKKVKKLRVEKKENHVINRLNKTKVERYPDLKKDQAARMAEEQKKEAALKKAQFAAEKAEKSRVEEEKEARSYENLMDSSNMTSNQLGDVDFQDMEDDFM